MFFKSKDGGPTLSPETLKRVRGISDLVFVSMRNTVVALERGSGEVVWWWKSPKGKSYATILVEGDCVFAGVYGYVYCLDAFTGELRWSNMMDGFGRGVTSLATIGGNSSSARHAAEGEAAAAATSTTSTLG